MSHVKEVLAEVKAKRVEADRLWRGMREIRRPWYAQFAPVLSLLPWIGMAAHGHFRGKVSSPWLLGMWAAISVLVLVLAVRQRDAMWRQVIAKKAPELDRELRNAPDA